MLSRWWGKILGSAAAVISSAVEVWMGFQPHPVTGRWSSPFYWRPLPLLLACSLVLLLATVVFARKGRMMALVVSLILAAWWVPVAFIAVSYHFWPSPLGTAAVAFPWFLVVPAGLLLGSLLSQIIAMRQAH